MVPIEGVDRIHATYQRECDPTSSTGIVSVTSIIFGNPCQIPTNIFIHRIVGVVIVNLLWPGRGSSIRPDDWLSPISLLLSLSPATKTFVANKHDDEYDNEEHEYDNKEAEYSCWLGHDISCSRYVSSIYIHS
jgi:hypothetical protein